MRAEITHNNKNEHKLQNRIIVKASENMLKFNLNIVILMREVSFEFNEKYKDTSETLAPARGLTPVQAAFETPTGKILKANGFDGNVEIIKNTSDEVIIYFNPK